MSPEHDAVQAFIGHWSKAEASEMAHSQSFIMDLNEDIRELIDDLCQMLNWRADHYPEHTLRSFLETVFRDDPKRVKLSFIPAPMMIGHVNLGT